MPRRKVDSSDEDDYVPSDEEALESEPSINGSDAEASEAEEVVKKPLKRKPARKPRSKAAVSDDREVKDIARAAATAAASASVSSGSHDSNSILKKILDNLEGELDSSQRATAKQDRVINYYGNNVQMLVNMIKSYQDWKLYSFRLDRRVVEKQLQEHHDGEYRYNYRMYDEQKENHFKKLVQGNAITKEKFYQQQSIASDGQRNKLKFRLDFVTPPQELKPDESVSIKSIDENSPRTSIFTNVNGVVTSLDWLNLDSSYRSPENYLLVATIKKTEDPKMQFIDPNLSIFKHNFSSDILSFIRIYQFNSQTQQLQLQRGLVFRGVGQVRKLKAVPLKYTGGPENSTGKPGRDRKSNHLKETASAAAHEGINDQIGLVGALFANGELCFLNVDKDGPKTKFQEITEFPIKIKLPEPHKITCFDYLNAETVIIGTQTGYIAEFTITDDDNDEPKPPNFFIRKHQHYIRELIIQREVPGYCNNLIVTYSYDCFTKITDYEHIHESNFVKARKFPVATMFVDYAPQMFSILQPFGNLVRGMSPKNIKFSSLIQSRHINHTVVTSVGPSSIHPFLISGANNGDILLTNPVNAIVGGQKATGKYTKQTRLFKFEYNESLNMYKISSNLTLRGFMMAKLTVKERQARQKKAEEEEQLAIDEYFRNNPQGPAPMDLDKYEEEKESAVEAPEPIPKSQISNVDDLVDDDHYVPDEPISYPPNVVVTHLKWCENVESFNWYAASVFSDLLVIDGVETIEADNPEKAT